ncbi:hypothetical protein JavanS289_0004 [Streptococcus satellite phage Javan289]|nr:hypothetical protein JavanS289_0004 [Streptococcus satellite phage Javan289]
MYNRLSNVAQIFASLCRLISLSWLLRLFVDTLTLSASHHYQSALQAILCVWLLGWFCHHLCSHLLREMFLFLAFFLLFCLVSVYTWITQYQDTCIQYSSSYPCKPLSFVYFFKHQFYKTLIMDFYTTDKVNTLITPFLFVLYTPLFIKRVISKPVLFVTGFFHINVNLWLNMIFHHFC